MIQCKSFYQYLDLGDANCSLCHGKGLIEKPLLPSPLNLGILETPETDDELIMSMDNKRYIGWCTKCFSPNGPLSSFDRVMSVMLFFASLNRHIDEKYQPERIESDNSYKEGFENGGKYILDKIRSTYFFKSPKVIENTDKKISEMRDGFD